MKPSRLSTSYSFPVLACMGLLCAGTVFAQAPSASPEEVQWQQRNEAREQERAQVQRLRRELQQRREAAEKSCWSRFAVEDCLREVRAQAREQDNQLHERELRINSEERQDKAEMRLRSIEQRQQEKRLPPPVQAQSRTGQPLSPAAVPAAGSEAGPAGQEAAAPQPDVQQLQQARDAQARERAVQQAQRLEQHQQEQAQRELSEAERRERVKKSMEAKQQSAKERRERKEQAMTQRKGEPLPIPENLNTPR